MKKLTDEEIKDALGTEFNYVMSNRAEIKAVVAAYDPKIGFTCLATDLVDSHGYDHSDHVDGNGNLCLIGKNSRRYGSIEFLQIVSTLLGYIKILGYYKFGSEHGFGGDNSGGAPSCSF